MLSISTISLLIFLSTWFVNYREKSIGTCNYNYNGLYQFVIFFLQFCQILFHVFWSSVSGSINVQDCYVFLINLSIYHHVMLLLIPGPWPTSQHFSWLNLVILYQLRLWGLGWVQSIVGGQVPLLPGPLWWALQGTISSSLPMFFSLGELHGSQIQGEVGFELVVWDLKYLISLAHSPAGDIWRPKVGRRSW